MDFAKRDKLYSQVDPMVRPEDLDTCLLKDGHELPLIYRAAVADRNENGPHWEKELAWRQDMNSDVRILLVTSHVI